jgi:hypothetical protein
MEWLSDVVAWMCYNPHEQQAALKPEMRSPIASRGGGLDSVLHL